MSSLSCVNYSTCLFILATYRVVSEPVILFRYQSKQSRCQLMISGVSRFTPVISKIFEHAVLVRFADYFTTSDHQFGFKKNLSCSHAIYCVRNVVDRYVNNGSTVNICTVDLSKDFDCGRNFIHLLMLYIVTLAVLPQTR